MSPTQMLSGPAPYAPTRDVLDRHDYGVNKNRKPASTGGGRAWSEEEEVYLLQTRLQKMPYKHIAAHLKKTELACRLHYHQLSHGSNRRKRTGSCSSGSSNDRTPTTPAAARSPTHESLSRPVSPPGSAGSYGPPGMNSCIQLPRIMGSSVSPRLPAILPKPASMALPALNGAPHSYSGPLTEQCGSHGPAHFQRGPSHQPTTPPLRLDCSALPPPSASAHTPSHVDLSRLHAIYSNHRAAFWAAIAKEYSPNTSPTTLEQAWKTGICCGQTGSTPITPVASPDYSDKDVYGRSYDKTRISAILGIDADPRTARDRDLVKRMEEQRFGTMPTTA